MSGGRVRKARDTDVTVRPASLKDAKTVVLLIEELFEPPGRRPPDYTRERAHENLRRYLEGPDGDVLLALAGDTVVGLATVYIDLPSIRYGLRCWVEDLVVTSSRRSGGVGRRLVDAATEWARERGCTHLQLESGHGRKDAHRFYRANGVPEYGLVFKRVIEPGS
jgi:GNAT superfamily N-acetyltransferase